MHENRQYNVIALFFANKLEAHSLSWLTTSSLSEQLVITDCSRRNSADVFPSCSFMDSKGSINHLSIIWPITKMSTPEMTVRKIWESGLWLMHELYFSTIYSWTVIIKCILQLFPKTFSGIFFSTISDKLGQLYLWCGENVPCFIIRLMNYLSDSRCCRFFLAQRKFFPSF